MLMSRLYINITTTSYCADPKKVVPVFGLDAKFGNNSILGYQISPNYVIFLQAVLLLLREIEGNRQSLSLNYLKLDYSLKLHLKLNLVILISNIYNWKWHYKIYLIPIQPVHSVLPWWDLYTKQKSSKYSWLFFSLNKCLWIFWKYLTRLVYTISLLMIIRCKIIYLFNIFKHS